MKWIPIAKAKVKFGQQYLVKQVDKKPVVGHLAKSETTASGIVHRFAVDGVAVVVEATHVAIVTDPSDQ